jgi:hypothetical protein
MVNGTEEEEHVAIVLYLNMFTSPSLPFMATTPRLPHNTREHIYLYSNIKQILEYSRQSE